MKIPSLILLLFIAAILNSCNSKGQGAEEVIKAGIENPYLGQEPPGSTPERFAPGLVSTEHYEYGGTFSQDMKEFYLIKDGGTYEESTFVVIKYENEQWTESIVSSRVGQPVISPDGKIMHLGRRYKELTDNGWSEIKYLDAPFNELLIMRLSSSANGTYYFDTYDNNDPSFPIRYSRLVDGKREDPKELGASINTGKNVNHPFIAPDESYLIWDAEREGGYGDSDIYISFRKQDGSWGEAINLGDKINTSAWEASASVTPDGKYLFFNRNVGSDDYEDVDIMWVDAQFIEELRPEAATE